MTIITREVYVLRCARCEHCGVTADRPPWPGWTTYGAINYCERCSNPHHRATTPRTARTTYPLPPAADQPDDNKPWLTDALCAQIGSDLFYPGKGDDLRPAKRICRNCPVRPQCLQWALDHHEAHGVWGGLSPEERNHLLAST